uniref:Saposin B-type domain-containing protein n=1 Tax=Trichobilharzia regenti TaxID=157069 RepID=A0AA85K0T7_TRIRE|nr:unnamed protein product [Trichobilharzia regenti]
MFITLLTVFCLINNFYLSTALALKIVTFKKKMYHGDVECAKLASAYCNKRCLFNLCGKIFTNVLNTIGRASKPEELCVNFQVCNATKVSKYFTERDDIESCRKCQVLSKSVSKLMYSRESSERLHESIHSGCSFFEEYKDQCIDYSKSLLDNVKEIVHFNLGKVCKVSCQ